MNSNPLSVFQIFIALLFSLAACNSNPAANKNTQSQSEISVDLAEEDTIGSLLIQGAADSLKQALLKAIEEKGATGAISFCQLNAKSITNNQMEPKTLIKRASNKYRNPDNKADSLEMSVMQMFEKSILEISSNPVQKWSFVDENEMFHLFKPILVQPLCLNCHGDPTFQIQTEVLQHIDSLYPNDQARGYVLNDLRGIWHVSFPYSKP